VGDKCAGTLARLQRFNRFLQLPDGIKDAANAELTEPAKSHEW